MRALCVVPLALLFNQLVDVPRKNRFEPYATQRENGIGITISLRTV